MRNIMRKLLTFLAIVTISASCFGIEWIDYGDGKFAEYVLNEEQSKNAFKYVFENGYALNKINTDTTAYKVPENSIKMYLYNYSIGENDTYSVVFVDNEAVYGIQLRNIDELVKEDIKKNKKKIDPSTAAKQSEPSWIYGPGKDFVEGLVEAAK